MAKRVSSKRKVSRGNAIEAIDLWRAVIGELRRVVNCVASIALSTQELAKSADRSANNIATFLSLAEKRDRQMADAFAEIGKSFGSERSIHHRLDLGSIDEIGKSIKAATGPLCEAIYVLEQILRKPASQASNDELLLTLQSRILKDRNGETSS